MKFIVASDIHCHFDETLEKIHNLIEENPDIDGILLAGDFTNTGSESEQDKFLDFISNIEVITAPPICFVTGNHERSIHHEDMQLRLYNVTDNRSLIYIERKTFILQGFNLSPCFEAPQLALEYERMTPYRDFDLGYYTLSRKADIILSHCPPAGLELSKCNWKGGKLDIGSPGLREYIEKHQPLLVVCGHVHEGGGMTEYIGKTKVVNTATKVMIVEL